MNITDEQFIQAMREAVAERGEDFVYPKGSEGWKLGGTGMCVYARTDVDEPACIIGTALAKCGVPLDELRDNEGENAEKLLHHLTDVSGYVRDAARTAQERQDSGSDWGHALKGFLYALELDNA